MKKKLEKSFEKEPLIRILFGGKISREEYDNLKYCFNDCERLTDEFGVNFFGLFYNALDKDLRVDYLSLLLEDIVLIPNISKDDAEGFIEKGFSEFSVVGKNYIRDFADGVAYLLKKYPDLETKVISNVKEIDENQAVVFLNELAENDYIFNSKEVFVPKKLYNKKLTVETFLLSPESFSEYYKSLPFLKKIIVNRKLRKILSSEIISYDVAERFNIDLEIPLSSLNREGITNLLRVSHNK